MSPEEIIAMAREAGFTANCGHTDRDGTAPPAINALSASVPVQWLERFAALVAAAEREACALVCAGEEARALYNFDNDLEANRPFWNGGSQIATSIEQARMLCDCYPTAGAALAAAPQPFPAAQAAEQQAATTEAATLKAATPKAAPVVQPSAVYAGLPERRRVFLCTKCGGRECESGSIHQTHPPCKCGYLGFAENLDFTEDQMRDFADRTHAQRMEQAAPKAAPMSPINRVIAYSAATKLRELGFVWDEEAEAWLNSAAPQPAPALLSDEELCQIEEPYLLNFRIPLGGQYDFARAVEKAIICKMGKAQAPQGETNVQLGIDSNHSAPGQQRDVARSVALGQPMGNGQDQAAGHPSAQGDKLLTVAERNIRSFLRSATFKSESDREAALNCVDVLWEAARAPAESVPAPPPPPECETEAEKRAFAFGWFKAQEAERMKADSVLEDAARYRFLAGHCRSTSEHWGGRWSIVVDGPAPKSHDSEDDFDEAVDAARKQGANHD